MSAALEAQSGWIVKVGLINQKAWLKAITMKYRCRAASFSLCCKHGRFKFCATSAAAPPAMIMSPVTELTKWTSLCHLLQPETTKGPGPAAAPHGSPHLLWGSYRDPQMCLSVWFQPFLWEQTKLSKRNHKQYYVNCWTGLFSCFCCSVLLTGFLHLCVLLWGYCAVTNGIILFSEATPYGFPTCGFKFSLDHFGCQRLTPFPE